MPTSGISDFTPIRNEIIKSALRKIGVVAQGENPTSTQYTESNYALNSMIQHWQTRGCFLWKVTESTLSLTAGVSKYIIVNDDILDIQNPYIVQNNNKWMLDKIPFEEYREISSFSRGIPSKYTIRVLLDVVEFYVYPPPVSNYICYYDRLNKLEDFVNATDFGDFKSTWNDALVYGLAYKICPEYGVPLQERTILKQEADELFREALAGSRQVGSIQFSIRR